MAHVVDGKNLTAEQAAEFLVDQLGIDATAIAYVGGGAWSRCFGFSDQGQDFVIRFGRHVNDFYKDRFAYTYTSADLPIPEVRDIGRAFDGYYAISTRAYGKVLETVSLDEWQALIPSLVDAFEAMRTVDLPAERGVGGWEEDGIAHDGSWSNHLIGAYDTATDIRFDNWRTKLDQSPNGVESFEWGMAKLREIARDDIPRSLIHADMIHGNVLAKNGRISSLFDWGCSRYGDHLYELAWFEFWAPWHPNLDVPTFRQALEARWQAVGYEPVHYEQRLLTCHLHIGVDHIVYNALIEDWPALAQAAERMTTLVPG